MYCIYADNLPRLFPVLCLSSAAINFSPPSELANSHPVSPEAEIWPTY